MKTDQTILSKKLAKVEPSATLAITAKAKAMKKEGKDVVILAAGEPDHDTPQVIKDAAVKAIQDGFTKYTPAGGTVTLKKAICDKLKKDNGLSYDVKNIVVSCGAKHSLYNALQAICNPGDEVIYIHPYWVSYPAMITLADAKAVLVETKKENGFRATAEDIKRVITDKTKALILNSPSNPAGILYSKEELAAISEVCLANDVYVISDEIYEKIIYDGKKHVSIASVSEEMKKKTILINGVSKSHSMTGWRIGYMACDEAIAKSASKLQGQSTSNPCSISQAAAEAALTEDMEGEFKKNLDNFTTRRDELAKMFEDEDKIQPLVPGGAFYMFCDISACGLDSFEFAKRLLDEKEVAVIPGGPFGDDRYIRISFATDMDTIREGITRIKDWIKTL